MQFERMTREDIERLSEAGYLLKPGTCHFVIRKAEECRSKSGNPQMKLEIEATDIEGKTASLFDYIFYSEAAKWKIVSFCKAINLTEKLEQGSLEPHDLINKKGQMIVSHEEFNGQKKNRVLRYLPYLEVAIMQSNEQMTKDFFDDQIPF